VRPNRIGHDVLVDLVAKDLLVGLVDLDYLFDPAVNVVSEERFDGLCAHGRRPRQKIFGR
jgi:hypothetical protein